MGDDGTTTDPDRRTGRSKRRTLLVIGAACSLAVVAYLAFAVFGVHTLFIDDSVDEALPEFDSGAGAPAAPTTPATTDAGATNGTSATSAPATATVPDPPASVSTVVEGSFVARSHPAEGRAFVLSDGAQAFLRFEDFATDNGPDLFVYLVADVDADSAADRFDDRFIDLGVLKGNIGDQNYELPAETDLSDYSTVVIWCRRFGVAFGAADLVPAG